MDYLKADRLTSTKWRVLAIPFGGPKDGKDTDSEFFSANTDIKAHWFDRRPLIWHHNLDRSMKGDSELGVEDDLEMEGEGWWATVWLDRANRYWQQIDQWLQQGKVYGSSGTLGNFARTDAKTGEILVWPHIEQTLTLTPANPFARVQPAKAMQHLEALGLVLPPDLDSPTADLPEDLPSGGDLAAMRRRLGALADAEKALLKTI